MNLRDILQKAFTDRFGDSVTIIKQKFQPGYLMMYEDIENDYEVELINVEIKSNHITFMYNRNLFMINDDNKLIKIE